MFTGELMCQFGTGCTAFWTSEISKPINQLEIVEAN